jgi:hypothetical protein
MASVTSPIRINVPFKRFLWRARESRGWRKSSLTSDLQATHFDGRPINRERPFLVGLSRIIYRLTDAADGCARQSMQLKREPNVDPMFCAKPTDGHFRPSSIIVAPLEFRNQALRDVRQDISRFTLALSSCCYARRPRKDRLPFSK